MYSTLLHFWPGEELTELADGPTGCGQVARGGCLFAWNFSMTRLTVLTGVEGRHLTEHDAVTAQVTCS